MADETVLDSVEQKDLMYLSFLDIFLLLTLLLGGAYYLLKRWRLNRKEIESEDAASSFTIIPTAVDRVDELGDEDGFVSKMKASGRNVVVFYGSQTGTAEEFAGRLAKEAARYGLKGMVADPEECEMEDIKRLPEISNSLALFSLATYGEGDPTDNAHGLFNWLQNGGADLKGVNYAVFGLGNKTYEHFNRMAVIVDKKLEEMGAHRIFEPGMGDDDGNLEEDFITWKERFWPSVCEHFGLNTTGKDINMRQYKMVVPTDCSPDRIYAGEITRLGSVKNQRPPFDAKNPFLAKILVNRELHKCGERSCMHIELDMAKSRIRYEAGDHVALYPTNDPQKVKRIENLLPNEDFDQVISLVSLDSDSHRKNPFPCPCTFRTALTHYLDISCIPYTHVLKEIADYATNTEEKEMLKLMGSHTPEGKAQYAQWVLKNCRSIIDILEDLPSLKPPLDHLCELLPRLQARYYSISSSPKLFPTSVHITAVLVNYETPTKRMRRGVATGLLADMRPEVEEQNQLLVPVFVRKSQFRLPAQLQTPVLLVGPGTGIAPFRAFIQERAYLKSQGKPVGEIYLYFGCRKQNEDYLYEDELAKYVADGVISRMYVAFSRDQEQKLYVTHLLMKYAPEVWKIIGESAGHLYVCGDAKTMARDVHALMKTICLEQGQMSDEEASVYVKKMETSKRYSVDVWS